MDRKEVLNRVTESYQKVEDRVKSGIDKNRKGDAVLNITDADGKPVSGAEIKISQKNHEFRHGANIFMLNQLENDEKNKKYKECFKNAFNMATLPFYWKDLEPAEGKTRYDKNSPEIYRRPATDLCMEFCEENGIEPREHGLAYEHCFPDWLENRTVSEIKTAYEKRCREISERYAKKIRTIEITNEHGWYDGKTAFYEEDEFVEDCFKIAEKYFPENELTINEWSNIWNSPSRNRDFYYMIIERALLKGARIDAVGMQYHMFFKAEDEAASTKYYYNMEHLFKVLDKYSEFGLPIQITEVTIPAYTQEAEDEEVQAEIIKNLYSVWFSHPSVEQIIYWNLVDGYAAFAPKGDMSSGENYYRGGLLRFDLTPKKAYNTIVDLFKNVWNTKTQCKTDEKGIAKFRGFYGEYDLEITCGGKTVNKSINLRKGVKNNFRIEL